MQSEGAACGPPPTGLEVSGRPCQLPGNQFHSRPPLLDPVGEASSAGGWSGPCGDASQSVAQRQTHPVGSTALCCGNRRPAQPPPAAHSVAPGSASLPLALTAPLPGLQVKSVNLSEGEVLSIRGVDGGALVILANQTLLVEGQVIRSPTNTVSVYFRTFQDEVIGTFQLHYQGREGACQ